jgi:uncharacterized membrane protein
MRLFGHPLHPALVHFPLALLGVVPLWDVAALVTGDPAFWAGAFYCLAAGLVAALVAAVPGFVDYVKLPEAPAVTRTAQQHIAWLLGALTLAATSALLRGGPGAPEGAHLWLGVAASVTMLLPLFVGGYFGGKLVFTHRVGVGSVRD